jgi:hypothetical protein
LAREANYNTQSFANTTRYSNNSIPFNHFGAWASYQVPLEQIKDPGDIDTAIRGLLKLGYTEYYFPIVDYEADGVKENIDSLLGAADKTALKMIAILFPPSEAGKDGNYDWDGWIGYLNSLKDNHPSLHGFTLDDFNWFSENDRNEEGVDESDNEGDNEDDDKETENNVEFMIESNLGKALQNKRKGLNFYPVIYFEGKSTNDAKRYFYSEMDGVILATPYYYNVTDLEHNLRVFSKVFDDKPLRYIVYTARTTAFIEMGYSPPSDRLILSTISIADKIDNIEGIAIWRNTDSHAIRDYLSNKDNEQYHSLVTMMERLQLKDENQTGTTGYSSIPFLKGVVENNGKDSDDKEDVEAEGEDLNTGLTVWLGISGFGMTPSIAEEMALPKVTKGVAIQSTVPGSPADKAGLKDFTLDVNSTGYLTQKADIIVAADGNEIDDFDDIIEQMENKQPGDNLMLKVNREGQMVDKLVKLEPLPK